MFAIGKDKGSRLTRLESWEKIKKKTGKDASLKPSLSDEARIIWELFVEIRKGCVDITHRSLLDYQDIFGESLTAFEIDMMLKLDKVKADA